MKQSCIWSHQSIGSFESHDSFYPNKDITVIIYFVSSWTHSNFVSSKNRNDKHCCERTISVAQVLTLEKLLQEHMMRAWICGSVASGIMRVPSFNYCWLTQHIEMHTWVYVGATIAEYLYKVIHVILLIYVAVSCNYTINDWKDATF